MDKILIEEKLKSLDKSNSIDIRVDGIINTINGIKLRIFFNDLIWIYSISEQTSKISIQKTFEFTQNLSEKNSEQSKFEFTYKFIKRNFIKITKILNRYI